MPRSGINTKYATSQAALPVEADATRDFSAKLADPARWIIKPAVPIFKAHERTDPATGQLIKVDLAKLHRIAANMKRLETQNGVPIRLTLGHTEPGKPETEQPPVGGYYRNPRVAPFGPKGEPAVVVDEWLDPQYASVRKNYPYRSSEYYDDAEQITGVALLTRDPYLDLGVVAYERGEALVCYTAESKPDRRTNYSRSERKPVLYHLVLGETQYSGGWKGAASGAARGAVQGAVAGGIEGFRGNNYNCGPGAKMPQTNYNPALIARAAPMVASAVAGMGGDSEGTPYSAPWPGGMPPTGSNYTPHRIGHQHQSGGAVYANNQTPTGGASMFGRNSGQGRGRPGRYADDQMGPPPSGPSDGGAPPGGGGAGGDPMQQLQMLLMAAVELLGQMGGGGQAPAGPPQSPMPPGAEGGQYARYANNPGRAPQRPRQYAAAPQRPYGRYESPAQPTAYGQPQPAQVPQGPPPPRTISGRPAGEAMAAAQLQYQLNQQGQVIKMLAYERDQADTEACVAEIQRLADAGYPVSEYEVGELKAKPRDQRGAYINHIATHYAKVGTEPMPQILGDPTPGDVPQNANRPATKEEMEAALKLAATSTDPLAYNTALEAVRYGKQQPAGAPVNRIAEYAQAPQGYPTGPADANPMTAEWTPPASRGFNPADPFAMTNGAY